MKRKGFLVFSLAVFFLFQTYRGIFFFLDVLRLNGEEVFLIFFIGTILLLLSIAKFFVLRSFKGLVLYVMSFLASLFFFRECFSSLGGVRIEIFELTKHVSCFGFLTFLVSLFLFSFLISIAVLIHLIKSKDFKFSLFAAAVSLYLSSFIIRAEKDWLMLLVYIIFGVILSRGRYLGKEAGDERFLFLAFTIFFVISIITSLVALVWEDTFYLVILEVLEYILIELFLFLFVFSTRREELKA
ncbi:hypothetical protein [Phorcysia thermohydrogeniphila]|uniref:Uncharacterized protein n=1 Tax=Phorcysia thermohydrogeniphila TaxID=936138 RepID=A0A4R1GBC9_9BACT|nr:hypothetical protein [Phorcysia thermohydrogeniphila]TCK05304.1 hypothetical protein CLV27_0731 [Phorcysia thermohydrogeniphila]